RRRCPGTVVVDRLREQLFAGARFSGDQDRRAVMGDDLRRPLQCSAELRAMSDDPAEVEAFALDAREALPRVAAVHPTPSLGDGGPKRLDVSWQSEVI